MSSAPNNPRFLPGGAALEELERRFNGRLRVNSASLSVGVTAGVVAVPDTERVHLTIVNLGTTTIFVAPGSVVSTTVGIRLGASGGLISMNVDTDAMLPCEGWLIISDAAGGAAWVMVCRRENRF